MCPFARFYPAHISSFIFISPLRAQLFRPLILFFLPPSRLLPSCHSTSCFLLIILLSPFLSFVSFLKFSSLIVSLFSLLPPQSSSHTFVFIIPPPSAHVTSHIFFQSSFYSWPSSHFLLCSSQIKTLTRPHMSLTRLSECFLDDYTNYFWYSHTSHVLVNRQYLRVNITVWVSHSFF